MRKMKVIATLLIVILIGETFSAIAQISNEKKIKEQVVMIPNGSIIEVELFQKSSSKIKGTLVSVTDEGFEIQIVKSGTVTSEKFAFADVKSVKEKHGMRTGDKILIGVGIGLATLGALIVSSLAHLSR